MELSFRRWDERAMRTGNFWRKTFFHENKKPCEETSLPHSPLVSCHPYILPLNVLIYACVIFSSHIMVCQSGFSRGTKQWDIFILFIVICVIIKGGLLDWFTWLEDEESNSGHLHVGHREPENCSVQEAMSFRIRLTSYAPKIWGWRPGSSPEHRWCSAHWKSEDHRW
jgi:hypothetical protein